MKSKEMEEQIEIKVSRQGGGGRRRDALGSTALPVLRIQDVLPPPTCPLIRQQASV